MWGLTLCRRHLLPQQPAADALLYPGAARGGTSCLGVCCSQPPCHALSLPCHITATAGLPLGSCCKPCQPRSPLPPRPPSPLVFLLPSALYMCIYIPCQN